MTSPTAIPALYWPEPAAPEADVSNDCYEEALRRDWHFVAWDHRAQMFTAAVAGEPRGEQAAATLNDMRTREPVYREVACCPLCPALVEEQPDDDEFVSLLEHLVNEHSDEVADRYLDDWPPVTTKKRIA